MIIFSDTAGLVSLFSEKDSNHRQAMRIVKKLKGQSFLISKYIFAEVVTMLSQKEGKEKSIIVGEHLKTKYEWIDLNTEIENLAWKIFKKQTSKNISFIDCTTIALYKDGAFDKLFTFDSDFKKNKVAILE